jgi:hypothetical protein
MTDSDRTGQSGDGELAAAQGARHEANGVLSRRTLFLNHKRLTFVLLLVGLFGVSALTLVATGRLSVPTSASSANRKPVQADAQPAETPIEEAANGGAHSSDVGKSSNVNIDVHSSSSSSESGNQSSSTVTVNGQTRTTTSGTVEEHYASDDGSTNVDISVQNNSEAE